MSEHQYWTKEEAAIVAEEYPKGGYRAVQAKLPDRSETSIRGKADRMGVGVAGRTYCRQPTSEWIDAAIRRAYEKGSVQVAVLARSLNRRVGWIKWRAREMGVSRQAPREWCAWTPDEDALLEACLEKSQSVSVIYKKFRQAGYDRTLSAICCRVETLELSWQRGFWSALQVGQALRVDQKRVVQWIERGQLKAAKGPGPSSDAELMLEHKMMWQIKLQDLQKFLIAHPHEWDHRKLSKEILLDLLLGDENGFNTGGMGIESARRLAG